MLEERYIVIKISKLEESSTESWLKNEFKTALVRGVVVESDWPMYTETLSKVNKWVAEEKRKAEFVRCKYCNGSGSFLVSLGHDCWGKSDNTYATCPVCKGSKEHNQAKYEIQKEIDRLNTLLQ